MASLYYPYIKPNYVAADGKPPLYVRYNYNRTKRTLISTGHNITPEHWDDKKRWIKRACPEFDEIDSALTKITSKLGEILTYAKDNGIDPIVDFVLLELEEIRDIFIVGCYTGLRYSDLSTLSPEHIDVANETISLKQRKVHKAVIIPMIDYVPDILEKYDYDLPKVPSYKLMNA